VQSDNKGPRPARRRRQTPSWRIVRSVPSMLARRSNARFPVIRLGTRFWAPSKPGPPAAWDRRSSTHWAGALPGLSEHGCSYRQARRLFSGAMREEEGTWLGHVLEHVRHRTSEHGGREESDLRQDAGQAERPGFIIPSSMSTRQRDEGIAAGDPRPQAAVLAPARRRSGRPTAVPDDLAVGRGGARMSSSGSRSAARAWDRSTASIGCAPG